MSFLEIDGGSSLAAHVHSVWVEVAKTVCSPAIVRDREGITAELPPDRVIFGATEPMQEIKRELERLSATELPVLIEGEGGTGKEVLARWLHGHSSRRHERFVKVHSPAIPAMLVESQLFGLQRGAFSGALRLMPGRIEVAGGGTFFLDEISELDIDVQATLLQLLQDGRFTRIADNDERPAETRFVCSSQVSLADASDSGVFRKELLYRINSVYVHLPALRNRAADIPVLVDYMLETFGRTYGVAVRPLPLALLNLLQACAWPGNIRQLENLIRRYVVLGCEGESISAELLGEKSPDLRSPVPSEAPLKRVVRERVKAQERKIILRTLYTHRWNRKETARALGISYQSLLHKMRQDRLAPPRRVTLPHGTGVVN